MLYIQMANAFDLERGRVFLCISDHVNGSLRTSYPFVCYVSLACLLVMYGLNGFALRTLLTNEKLRNDQLFQSWRTRFRHSSYPLVLVIQSATSFKFSTLWVSGWLGRKRYKAQFSHSTGLKVWDRLVNHMGVASLLFFSIPTVVICVAGLRFHEWGS